jgi:hypothetical protein
MAKTEWSKRTVYEVQVRQMGGWVPTLNLKDPRYHSRKQAEIGMRRANIRGFMQYRVKVVSSRG